MELRKHQNRREVWDPCRKKWVPYTPEEHVRQSILQLLNKHYHYPFQSIAVERQFKVNQRIKRFDILCFNASAEPFMMIECKAPDVALDETVAQQIIEYSYTYHVPVIAISNGSDFRLFDTRTARPLSDIPTYR